MMSPKNTTIVDIT